MPENHHADGKTVFIAFEGINGCGKSTQVKLAADWLRTLTRREVIVVRDPGGTPIGEKIRAIVKDPEQSADPKTILLLYVAARLELSNLVDEHLRAGRHVIADRWIASTFAYQCYGMGIDLGLVTSLIHGFNPFRPDCTIWLDVPIDIAVQRMASAPVAAGDPKFDRFESAGPLFQAKLRTGYRAYVNRSPRCLTINGVDGPHSIQASVQDYITKILKGKSLWETA